MIFGTILGIQLDEKPDGYSQNSVMKESNFAETESVEVSVVDSLSEPENEEAIDMPTEKSVLSKLGQGLNHALSGISEKAVSGLE